MSEFSVIIPTLQRAAELHELVEMCAAHPLVLEVLVINNAPAPLRWESPKVRVLQQAQNIYVNPAWNLGAREARGEYLAILNDDVMFAPRLLDDVARHLRRPFVGLIGVGEAAINADGAGKGRTTFAPSFTRTTGYGMAMFLQRSGYVPVPEDMLIWHGDDWLYTHQRSLNWELRGTPVLTEVSVTSGDPAFRALLGEDSRAAREHGDGGYAHRTRWARRVWERLPASH
ncbi:glycosyl transferase family 2 [Micrococcaceae bacterium JKS001869]|nr:glycosyl transferase family 2 [Micrococcaceae bacterium JKS001869]